MPDVIQTQNLTKRYGKFVAVNKLNLAVKEGEVFGLLGPNGSGKTTTILMLLGLTDPSAGSVQVVGLDPARAPLAVKRSVGYLPDAVGFYDDMSAQANLRYSARLNGLSSDEADKRIAEVLERMSLSPVANKRVGAFSRGMKQRLGLADVLLKTPKVAILDEPTASLDPQAAHEFLDLIKQLKSEGISILLSSHLLPQVQAVCDRVGLFRQGKMVLEGSVTELAGQVLGSAFRIEIEARGKDLNTVLQGIPGISKVSQLTPDTYLVEASKDIRPRLASQITSAGAELYNLRLEQRSLDEVYSHYFQEEEFREAA